MKLGALEVDDAKLASLCAKHQVARLDAFGSVLRPDFGPGSDVDLLVRFQPGYRPGLLALSSLEEELAELLGRRVDMAEPSQLKWVIRDRVLEEAQVVFAA